MENLHKHPDVPVVVLAGGLGTRLRSAIGDAVPKPLAPVLGKPFLYYLIRSLGSQSFTNIVVSAGYLAERIEHEVHSPLFEGLKVNIRLVREDEEHLLGTGGAIVLAASHIDKDTFFVCNGDTYGELNLKNMYEEHIASRADVTIGLLHVDKADRYGIVQIDENQRVVNFNAGGSDGAALINSGTYLLNTELIKDFPSNRPLSMENTVLPELIEKGYNVRGFPWSGYFIDIGIPDDYARFIADCSY